MDLYRHHPMPIAISGSNQSVRFKAESDILAVSPHQDAFLMLNQLDLNGCEQFGDLFLCKHTSYVLRDLDKFCITSLYQSKSEEANRNCQKVLVPPKVEIRQISNEIFFVFHPTEMRVEVRCDGQVVDRQWFRGTKAIKVAQGCTAFNSDYILRNDQFRSINFTCTSTTTLWKLESLLNGMTVEELNSKFPGAPFEEIDIPVPEFRLDDTKLLTEADFAWPWRWMLGSWGATTITVLLIVVAVLSCALCCCRQRMFSGVNILPSNLAASMASGLNRSVQSLNEAARNLGEKMKPATESLRRASNRALDQVRPYALAASQLLTVASPASVRRYKIRAKAIKKSRQQERQGGIEMEDRSSQRGAECSNLLEQSVPDPDLISRG